MFPETSDHESDTKVSHRTVVPLFSNANTIMQLLLHLSYDLKIIEDVQKMLK